jgi:hypothetical protein
VRCMADIAYGGGSLCIRMECFALFVKNIFVSVNVGITKRKCLTLTFTGNGDV